MSETIHGRIAEVMSRVDGSYAVIDGERRWTYRQLDEAAAGVARAIAGRDAGPGSFVPVVAGRSGELAVALVGILRSGAAYAPLDPAWPPARLAAATRALGASFAVVDAPVTGLGIDQAFLGALAGPGAVDGVAAADKPVSVGGDSPACVFFTSGSTGAPKGVVSPHRATLRLFEDAGFMAAGAGVRMPLASAVPWDAFSLELWGMLTTGGTCVVVREPFLAPGRIKRLVRDDGVTVLWLTASLFNAIIDADIEALAGLQQVLVGGERLSTAHVSRFLARFPATRLTNGYGPVESTVFVTTHDVTPGDVSRRDGIPIGRPVGGTTLAVVDGDLTVPDGSPGELVVGGAGVALGYLGLPDETRRRFVYMAPDGERGRFYRTGDRVVRDEEGVFHFLGRMDRQVKVRGHRIELDEVEYVAASLAGVRQAAVLAEVVNGTVTGLSLAYAGDWPPEHVRVGLAAYAVPRTIRQVEALPLLANGKVDRRRLAVLTTTPMMPPTGAAAGDAPRGGPAGGSL